MKTARQLKEPGPGKMLTGPGPRRKQGQVSTATAVLPEVHCAGKRGRDYEWSTHVCVSVFVCRNVYVRMYVCATLTLSVM